MRTLIIFALFGLLCAGTAMVLAQSAPDYLPEPYAPGEVSTPRFGEVKLAISPDGQQEIWGTMNRTERGRNDLWERHRQADGSWSQPAPMALNSANEDFDPAFSPDGERLYFHSSRPGGFGGTDIYVAERVGEFSFGEPRNLGASVNTSGQEWAPYSLADGRVLFASDGWGGEGNHDIYIVDPETDEAPRKFGPSVNSPLSEFDPAVSADGNTIIFSRGLYRGVDTNFAVWRSDKIDGEWSEAHPVRIGCGTYTIGLAFLPQGDVTMSSRCSDTERGSMDIFIMPRSVLDAASQPPIETQEQP